VNRLLMFLVVILSGIGYFATDVYLHSMPAIGKYFKVGNELVQFTLTIYLFCFSFIQLLYGPLSDHFGRKKLIIFCLCLGILGSYLCYRADSIYYLIIARFVQGLGLGGVSCVVRAILPDLYSGVALARCASVLSIFVPIFLCTGPIIGGYLEDSFAWRSSFLFLVIVLCCILIIVQFKLPETNKLKHVGELKYKSILANYKKILCSRVFLGYTFCGFFASAGIMSYLSIAPFLFQDVIGLSPVQFGWLAIVVCLAVILAGTVNSHLVEKLGINFMLTISGSLMLLSGVTMLVLAYLSGITLLSCIIPTFIFMLGVGFSFGLSMAGAITPFKHIAGTACAVVGSLQMIGGTLFSAIAAVAPEHNQIPLALVYVVCGLGSLTSLRIATVNAANIKHNSLNSEKRTTLQS
jgi:DHA1 family 2-module integral membrane pump EmrD-like MFS transporter